MVGDLTVINPEAFISAFEAIRCGKVHVASISNKDFEVKQKPTKPLDGYEAPSEFPNCCEGHKQIFKIAEESLAAFPNCCKAHKKLNSAHWFKKENYSYLPEKLVTTVAYTFHCVSKCINSSDWYKKITDYIDYTKKSFGQFPEVYGPPLGCKMYLHNIEKNIEADKDIPVHKKEKILAFIQKYNEP